MIELRVKATFHMICLVCMSVSWAVHWSISPCFHVCHICSSPSLTVSFTVPFLLCNLIKILVFASKLYSVSFFPPIIFSFPLHGVFPSHQVVQISSICIPPYEGLFPKIPYKTSYVGSEGLHDTRSRKFQLLLS